MRVAVIGAGPAGLACAITLERLGIRPDVFEKGNQVGYPVALVHVLLPFSHPEMGDQLSFLQKEYGLVIQPLALLSKMGYHSKGVRHEVTGAQGYVLLRGRDEGSVERQLAGQLSTGIHFCHWADAERLAGEYDYVVVADGSGRTARQAGVWRQQVRAMTRGAMILGQFEPGTIQVYFDTAYAGHGFGVLHPFNSRRAMLTLHLVGGPGDRMDHKWRLFLARENLVFDVFTRFDLVYAVGTVSRHQTGNILLAGNAGGLVEPVFGLGLFASMASGVLAARAIAGQGDYERMLTVYTKRQEQFAAVRAAVNTLDQAGLSRVVGLLGLPLVDRLVSTGRLDVIGLLQPWLAGAGGRTRVRPDPG